MRATIKRKNLRRLASLSALGAGAMVAGVSTAEADLVTVNVNQSVGFDPGFGSGPVKVSLPGGAGFSLVASLFNPIHGSAILTTHHVTVCCTLHGGPGTTLVGLKKEFQAFWENVGVATHGLHVSFGAHGTLAFSQGGKGNGFPTLIGFTTIGRKRAFGVASRLYTRTLQVGCDGSGGPFDCFRQGFEFPFRRGSGNLTNSFLPRNNFPNPYQYFHFTFQDNGQTLSGWGQLDVTVAPGVGPDAMLVDYAYETPTAPPPPVPEPSEAVPLALSALVLGAAGIRRWRAAKTS